MNKTYIRNLVIGAAWAFLTVAVVSAQPNITGAGGSLTDGINTVGTAINAVTTQIIGRLVTLFATLAMAAFFWGLVKFILASRAGKPEEIENGKRFMGWSIVALFVMFSIWGIINYAQRIFGTTDNNIRVPRVLINGQSVSDSNAAGLPTGGNGGGGGGGGWVCNGTTYSTQAAAIAACSGTTSGNNNGTASGQTYLCNGTTYTTQAAAVAACSGTVNNNQNGAYGYDGNDPNTTDSDTAIMCAGITDAETCSQMDCTWDDRELSCSQ